MTHDNPHKPKPKHKRGTLPAFTPVPRAKERSNGWKPEIQRGFIEALADTGSVEAACRRVNRAAVGAYQLRRHPEGREFRRAWEAALALGIQRIEDVAMDRALNGVEVPVYSYGKLVGTRRAYNDRLLMFMLRNRAPKRFAADGAKGMNAVDRAMLTRLKREWRQEWERERALLDDEDEDAILASLDAKIEAMRDNRLRLMSPKTRALQDALWAAEAQDRESGYAHLTLLEDQTEGEEEDSSGADEDPDFANA